MPLVRLATLEDYEAFELMGQTMYRVRWHPSMCPGNPTEHPAEGLSLFNEWQQIVATGESEISDPGSRLDLIANWCLSNRTEESAHISSLIIKKYKHPDFIIGLEFSLRDYSEPALGFRYELAFLNEYIQRLSASTIMQLQVSLKGNG